METSVPSALLMTRHTDNSEERAFTEAVQPHLTKMLSLARRLGRTQAEDIVQESLERAWDKRAQYDPARGTFSAWLFAITADRAYKVWRRTRRHSTPITVGPSTALALEEAIDLEASLAKLSGRQRLAVDCYYFVGLSVAETAAVMGCSQGTVKSTLAAARGAIRDQLSYRP